MDLDNNAYYVCEIEDEKSRSVHHSSIVELFLAFFFSWARARDTIECYLKIKI